VASPELPTTVYPFILRAVSLLGIDSQSCPMDVRRRVWRKLAGSWRPEGLESVARERRLEDLEPEIERILRGEQRGRVVVRLPWPQVQTGQAPGLECTCAQLQTSPSYVTLAS